MVTLVVDTADTLVVDYGGTEKQVDAALACVVAMLRQEAKRARRDAHRLRARTRHLLRMCRRLGAV